MSDTLHVDLPSLTAQPGRNMAKRVDIPTPDGTRKTIGRKLKTALDLMVWEGKLFNEAAATAGFNVHAMRKALERPHVRQYLREQKQVFRDSASAKNYHRAVEIRDQDENRTAAVQAIKLLEGEEASVSVNIDIRAGYVMDLREPERQMRDVTPRMTDDSEQ